MKTIQTLEQRRARHAWDAVQEANSANASKEYSREAKRLPVRILTAGLGHAIAFIAFADAKRAKSHCVADDVSRWVLAVMKCGVAAKDEKQGHAARQLIEQIIRNDADWLRRATEEALAYLRWLSRLAESSEGENAHEGIRGHAEP